MAVYWSLLLIALAVSLDSCSVGLLYGARGIRIPWYSITIIAACSGFVIGCSMLAGKQLGERLSPDTASLIGALILVLIGVWTIIQFFWHNRKEKPTEAQTAIRPAALVQKLEHPVADEQAPVSVQTRPVTTLLRIELRKLGLVIHILKSPSAADIDRSGTISPWEAALLGAALSLDALGAGVGAAMVGFPPAPTALTIALAAGLFLAGGLRLGGVLSRTGWMRHMTVLPGFLLIALGIFKLL